MQSRARGGDDLRTTTAFEPSPPAADEALIETLQRRFQAEARHESAHGQEGSGGGGLTEGGPPRHSSAHGQEGSGGSILTDGGLPRHESTIDALDPTFGYAQYCSTLWQVQRDSDSTTLDGVTMITKDNAPRMPLPSLCAYQSAASRGPESVPALFYRQMMGEAWDGKAHSYSLATKKFRRLLPAYQRDEQEREQRRKQLRRMHALAAAKAAAPISAPECANAPAAATAAAASAAESTAVCACTSPQPRRHEPRFQGDYKAFRKADNAWHERRRRERLRCK